jgi:EpsI family protein
MTTKPHIFLSIGILALTLAASVWSENREPEILARPLDSIDREIGGWVSGNDETLKDTIVASLDATSYLSRAYSKNQQSIDFFAAFYAQQKAGESMHSPRYCLPGSGWEFTDFRLITLPFGDSTVQVNRTYIQKPGRPRTLVFYWYQSRSRVVASEYQSKYFLVWDGLVHANPGGSIVRVLLNDRPGAEEDGAAFATQALAEIQKCFRPR